jgi:2-amino-4-hydroxy-6-hydroxymethyldihydropteridine diphosphokinase
VADRVRTALGLGSNLGDRQAQITLALDALAMHPHIDILAVSALYQTPPWGKTDQPAFFNAAALVETDLAPRTLLETVLGIERSLGRLRNELWGPRTIDLDILLYGDQTVDEPGLTIPHPRIQERAFVIRPLADILPDAMIAGRCVSDWLAALDVSGIDAVANVGWYPAGGSGLQTD